MMFESNLSVCVCHETPLLRAGLLSLITESQGMQVLVGCETRSDPRVDVIVADYASALSLLAANPEQSCAPPIVVLTWRDTERDVVHAISSGVHGYLLHDADPLELIDAIRHVARGGSTYLCKRSAPVLKGAKAARLTVREEEVLCLVAKGDVNMSIARSLKISPYTVKAHGSKICEKLQVHSRAQAAAAAARRGLVR